MNEKLLHLEDGTTISAKVNFATLYYMEKSGITKLNLESTEEEDALEAAARMLWVLLQSNGRPVTFQEALVLCPLDTDEVQEIFDDFKERLEAFKKKQDAKRATQNFVRSL